MCVSGDSNSLSCNNLSFEDEGSGRGGQRPEDHEGSAGPQEANGDTGPQGLKGDTDGMGPQGPEGDSGFVSLLAKSIMSLGNQEL